MRNLKYEENEKGPMAKTIAKTRKVGGSLMVTIPREVVEQEDLREGVLVELEVRKARRSFFGVASGIGPFTREDKMGDHD